jgi:CheY-like chemotaxis protein/signal transduction histidine kinase
MEGKAMSQVLIIDDEAGIRDLLRLILERKGYSVETATDGRVGLQKFRQQPAELVISDIIMPNVDGLELIRSLKRESPAVKIISISGGGKVGAGNYLDLATKLGASYAFEKPIDREALLNAVEELLVPATESTTSASTTRSTDQQIEAQSSALAARENLTQLMETVPHFFWILDHNRQVVLANSVSLKVLGLTKMEMLHGLRPGEAVGCRNAAQSPHGCGTATGCATCGALKAIASAQEGAADNQECRILQQTGGDALDLRVWTHPLSLGDGSCIVFQAQDIAHEKRREALERTFFHDLLNVAGGLRNGLGMLGDMDTEEQAEVLPMLATASQALLDEIEAQKDLLGIESGTYDATLASFQSLAVLQSVVECYRHHPVAKGRHLVVEKDSSELALTSDRRLMTRVLGNMVKNALEACADGDEVTLGCRAEGDGVVFWVHNPQHMPEAVQLQIFQRSYSTKGRGRGLGTFGMRLLTERYLQGSVAFTSTAASGTTFTAHYPLVIDSIDASTVSAN